jgi:uncharacterized integral membrane protein (TIGR00698 family)
MSFPPAPLPHASLAAIVLNRLPGLLLTGALTALATWLATLDLFAQHGISALTLAIVLGMIAGNAAPVLTQGRVVAGVTMSKQYLLRLGIVLYGLRLTLQDVAHVGLAGVFLDTLMISSTFGLALLVGTRWLRMDRDAVILIGAGSSICGAAAVLATEPVVRAQADKIVAAVATVVVFGTISIFIYPLLYDSVGQALAITHLQYGIYVGSTVHEVAQVLAAAHAVSPQAADIAVITKMVRVMMLAPFLLALSFWLARGVPDAAAGQTPTNVPPPRIAVPSFALGFIAVMLLHSFVILPAVLVSTLNLIATIALSMAMAALGLTTHVSAIRRAGVRPLLLAMLLFCWLVVGGFVLNYWLI